MLRVGLTGGIASGKSTVAALFSQLGVPIIDADIYARLLVAPETPTYQTIIEHFGPSVVNADGSLNRPTLRERIFNSPTEKLWLENLLHPLIRQAIIAEIAQVNAPYCLIVIPLLSEAKGIDFIDRICVVDCDPAEQLQRLENRDQLSTAAAQAIINQQHSREQRLQIANDVITNSDKQSLAEQVAQLHQLYLRQARRAP